MSQTLSKQHIRFTTIEKSTAWIVVAVLVENDGVDTVAVSEPKIVRIIPKPKSLVLTGSVGNPKLCLSCPEQVLKIKSPVKSPFSILFGYSNTDLLVWYCARPPTV